MATRKPVSEEVSDFEKERQKRVKFAENIREKYKDYNSKPLHVVLETEYLKTFKDSFIENIKPNYLPPKSPEVKPETIKPLFIGTEYRWFSDGNYYRSETTNGEWVKEKGSSYCYHPPISKEGNWKAWFLLGVIIVVIASFIAIVATSALGDNVQVRHVYVHSK